MAGGQKNSTLKVKLPGRKLRILVFILTVSMFCSFSSQQKISRETAVSAFNKGNYQLAYDQFSELLSVYPRDPLYKYYSGICLVQMKKDPETATELLKEARKDDAILRRLPSDVLFWYGRALQSAGRFDEAVTAFTEFTDQAGRKRARELNTQEFIQQCIDKKGKISITDTYIAETDADKKIEVRDEKETVKGDPDVKAGNKEFPVYRPKEPVIPSKQPDSIPPAPGLATDTMLTAVTKVEKTPGEEADTTFEVLIDEHVAEAVRQPVASGVLMLFRIDPPPVHETGEKISINPVHPPGLIYRIQLAVFRNPVTTTFFKGIVPVCGIRNDRSGLTTYYAGMFRKNDDARTALPQVKQKGFRDAFIVAFSGGKPVSLERAAILEKEWGIIPFTPEGAIIKEIQADTIPPTLSFRVEVTRVKKPVGEGTYEEMKKLSGTRGLDVESLPDGNIVYLIGRFITYESAVNYADLLVRNGYRDSKVVAWLGKKEIPVETARQLFNSLK